MTTPFSPTEGAPAARRGGARGIEVSERAFKHLAFWSTLVGLVLMAIGLKTLLFDRSFLLAVLLFVGGAAVASANVLLRPRAEPGFVIELLTREGCSLCEEAEAWLQAKAPEYDFALWVTNVDADPTLAATYGDHVPVGFLHGGSARRGREGGEELFRLRADYPALEKRFRRLAEARVRGR